MRQGALLLGAELAELAPGPSRDDVLLILARRLVVCIPPEVFADTKNAGAAIGARYDGAHFTPILRAVVKDQEGVQAMQMSSAKTEKR